MTEQEFVQYIGPLAHQDMESTGILASITAAQACLESGYGSTELAKKREQLLRDEMRTLWKYLGIRMGWDK